jgi:dienelactone hydrolase
MRRRWLLAVLLGLAAALASAAAWANNQGSASGLEARKGLLLGARRTGAGGDAVSTFEQLTLRSSTGQEVRAIIRVPRSGTPPYPATVLVGGIGLGRKVAMVAGLDAIGRYAIVVSPDYPVKLHRRDWEGLNFLATTARLRGSAFDLVAQIGLQIDYLASRPDVKKDKIFLVGSSLGAPAVVIAGAVDPRPAAVIPLYGGGMIASLVTHALQHGERDPFPAWQAAILARTLALFLTPLEPTRYAGRIAPRHFLMVNGADDSLIPRANVDALFEAARSPKDIIWIRSEHIEPDEKELIRTVAGRIAAWLGSHGLLPPEAAREREGTRAP